LRVRGPTFSRHLVGVVGSDESNNALHGLVANPSLPGIPQRLEGQAL
jgi:hypothetical protein